MKNSGTVLFLFMVVKMPKPGVKAQRDIERLQQVQRYKLLKKV